MNINYFNVALDKMNELINEIGNVRRAKNRLTDEKMQKRFERVFFQEKVCRRV